MTRRTSSLALAGAATLLVLLAACQPSPDPDPTEDPRPSVIATPKLTEAASSTSPLESDEFVTAARAADLGFTLAANNADFTIEQFTSTRPLSVQRDQYRAWASTYLGTGQEAPISLGPSVLLPLSVTDAADGAGTVVEFCRADGALEAADASSASFAGHVVRMTIVAADDGTLQLEGSQGSTTECDATGASVAFFDPAPQPLGLLDEGDARAPLE